MTTMRSHRAALALYAGMWSNHSWTTTPIRALFDLALAVITDARFCFRCGGRGLRKEQDTEGRWHAVKCDNCKGVGLIVETRSAPSGGGVSW